MITNIRKIDLNLLVALKVMLEEHNTSRAAERLALTQPTVSGMLSRLRVLFDDPLFIRTQHGMVPTPRAEAMAPALERLLQDAADLVAPSVFDPRTVEMDLRISANDYMRSTVLVPLVRKLRREARRVRVALQNLEIKDLPMMLARGELDLAISIPEFVDASLETKHLYREEYVCIVRQSHPVRSATISMKRFLEYDHVLVSPSGGLFSGPVDDALAARGLKRRVALSVPGFLTLLDVLQTDDLIATVPRRFLEGRSRDVRRVKPPIEVQGFDVIAAWHGRLNHDPAHRWVRDLLVRVSRSARPTA